MKSASLIVFIVIVTCVSTSFALRCYKCSFPKACEDPKDMEIDECSDVNSMGVKSVCWKNVINVKEVEQISRSCTTQLGTASVCSALKDNVKHCSVCETDLCNDSSNLAINKWATLFIAMATIVNFFV